MIPYHQPNRLSSLVVCLLLLICLTGSRSGAFELGNVPSIWRNEDVYSAATSQSLNTISADFTYSVDHGLVSDTLINTRRGVITMLEVKTGDSVQCAPLDSYLLPALANEVEWCTVSHTNHYPIQTSELVTIDVLFRSSVLNETSWNTTIIAHRSHLFWESSLSRWIAAEQLLTGHILYTTVAYTPIVIITHQLVHDKVTVTTIVDLTADPHHNFLVTSRVCAPNDIDENCSDILSTLVHNSPRVTGVTGKYNDPENVPIMTLARLETLIGYAHRFRSMQQRAQPNQPELNSAVHEAVFKKQGAPDIRQYYFGSSHDLRSSNMHVADAFRQNLPGAQLVNNLNSKPSDWRHPDVRIFQDHSPLASARRHLEAHGYNLEQVNTAVTSAPCSGGRGGTRRYASANCQQAIDDIGQNQNHGFEHNVAW